MRTLLYLIFVLSGAAGLIYESIWSHYLGLFVGHSAYAQIIVLAIFLGGMSLGAMLVGQRSERLREPLLWYARIELAVALIGVIFHSGYEAITQLAYTVIFPALAGSAALVVVKWTIAGLLILPQSILLGATFPFMSAGVLRYTAGQTGRVLSLLYFANSIGAAIGVLVSGFVLIAWVGLPGTILTAAACNAVAALVTFLVARRGLVPTAAPEATAATAAGTAAAGTAAAVPVVRQAEGRDATLLWRLLLLVSFGTAIASFVYEIAWIRMLSLVLGSATHSFELMLSAFILGLACGAFWVRRRADRFRDPVRTLALVQWVMGCAALLTLPIYLSSFEWMRALILAFDRTDQGYFGFNLARYGICLTVMLPATFCAGITLPLITRMLLAAGHGERAIGWVYGINTFGSIAGVIAASLVLMPLVGLKTLLIIGAACDMGVGVLLFASRLARTAQPTGRLALASALGMVAVVALVAWGAVFDPIVMTSGVYRHGRIPRPGARELLFYKDGRTATVAGARVTRDGLVLLSTNGKTDASLTPDWFTGRDATKEPTPLERDAIPQVLLPLVALAHVPQARHAAIIGHGCGHSSHVLLGSPRLERLVTIEIEPEMITGSRIFYPANRRVFDDPRSVFVIDDAKSFFASQPQKYDLIMSEPSNPWVSGVSSLFTEEFYRQVVPLLSADGIFGQWLQLYELSDDLVLSVLSALHKHFRSYQIFLLSEANILIVASNRATLPQPEWSVFTWPDIAADLTGFLPLTAESLEAMRLLDRAALKPLLDTWPTANSDYYPILDLGAEKARYMASAAHGILGLSKERFHLAAPLVDQRAALSTVTASPIAEYSRLGIRALSATLRAWRADKTRALPAADESLREAVQRLAQWEQALRAELPPADWQFWVKETLKIEDTLHGVASGAPDETFYEMLHTYLARQHPPAEACNALLFREGLARWDFATAAQAASRLLAPAISGQVWVPLEQLLDGGVVAKLMQGDTDGARQFYKTLSGLIERADQDLRSRLLASYVLAPPQLPTPPMTRMTWTCGEPKTP